jgi:hypothetical protein
VFKPELFGKKVEEISLSGEALIELLRAVLGKGVPFRFQAKGYSMAPFINDSDVVTVAPLTDASLRIGDVAAFIRPDLESLVVHRVIGKRGNSFLIQGDNIFETDGSIPKANIMGRVVKVERDGKNVIMGLGPGRVLIAFLVRGKLLIPLVFWVRTVLRPIMRR